MVSLGQKPDGFTFIGVLIACSHARLVKEGLKYFNQMQSLYGIDPKIEHYACVVDMLGRSGQFMYHHAPYGTYATSLLNLLLNVNFVLCKYFLMPLPIWFKIQDLDKPPLMRETFFYPGIVVYHACCIIQLVYGDNGSSIRHVCNISVKFTFECQCPFQLCLKFRTLRKHLLCEKLFSILTSLCIMFVAYFMLSMGIMGHLCVISSGIWGQPLSHFHLSQLELS